MGFTPKIVSYRAKLPLAPPPGNKNNLTLMLTNLECHLQFLERYLYCTLCHAAGTLALAKPVLGGRGEDGE